jgi:hypothetical protein
MMLQPIKIAVKRHFSDAPVPLSEKRTTINFQNNPAITLLHDGNHKPQIKILPYIGPGIVTTEGQIHPAGMEADPGGHINEILHHRAQTPSLRHLSMINYTGRIFTSQVFFKVGEFHK